MKFLDRLTQPSDSEAQERIVALEASISQHDQVIADYEAKLAIAETALAEVETLKADNLALTEKLAGIPELENAISMHIKTIDELKEQTVITDEKISAAAAQKLAAQGHGEPVVITGNVSEKPANSLTLSEFNALTPKARMAFIKAKGQLTD